MKYQRTTGTERKKAEQKRLKELNKSFDERVAGYFEWLCETIDKSGLTTDELLEYIKQQRGIE